MTPDPLCIITEAIFSSALVDLGFDHYRNDASARWLTHKSGSWDHERHYTAISQRNRATFDSMCGRWSNFHRTGQAARQMDPTFARGIRFIASGH
jgi:hypothetical protein